MSCENYLIHAGRPGFTPPELPGLLLLADPDPEAVARYLAAGRWYGVQSSRGFVAAAVVQPMDDHNLELMNIAVEPSRQGQGLGRALLTHVINAARGDGYGVLHVATGNSSLVPLALYQKLGFRITGVTPDYFTHHYPEPIIENGILCRDRLHLSLDLREENAP